jgi:ankyrin repeat protein
MKKLFVLFSILLIFVSERSVYATILTPCNSFTLGCASSTAAVRFLIFTGSDVNKPDNNGVVPIQKASLGGNLSIVELLLENGADIEAKNRQYSNWQQTATPLEAAVKRGKTEVVRFLLKKGANFSKYRTKENAIKASLINELYYAVSSHKLDNIRRLIEKEGVDVNSNYSDGYKYRTYGRPIKHIVAHSESSKTIMVLKYLLQKGADVNFKDSKGVGAFDTAKRLGMIQYLKILAPNYSGKTNPQDMAYLELQKRFFQSLKNNDIDGVKKSIASGAKINVDCKELIAIQKPCPALAHALSKQNIELMEVLLKAGADIDLYHNVKNKLSLLESVAWAGNTKSALWLIEKGAIVDSHEEYSRTALHNASFSNDVDIINALLDKGANIEAYNIDGTPLIWAANRGSLEAVKVLVNRGANVNATRKSGQTGLSLASRYAKRKPFKDGKYQEVADYLEPLVNQDKVKKSLESVKELHRKVIPPFLGAIESRIFQHRRSAADYQAE